VRPEGERGSALRPLRQAGRLRRSRAEAGARAEGGCARARGQGGAGNPGPELKLERKRILITGGGSGIGLALARRLADANEVVIAPRDEAKLDRAGARTPALRTLRLGHAVYAATKAALHSLARSLRAELADTRIHVFEGLPPVVDTDLERDLDVPKIPPSAVVDRSSPASNANLRRFRWGGSSSSFRWRASHRAW
jgi:NAD(P)-dependent dehydrogenase (short-subunit alcohol dehydrogenase family)